MPAVACSNPTLTTGCDSRGSALDGVGMGFRSMNNAGFVNRDGEHCRTDSCPLIALPVVTPPVCLVLGRFRRNRQETHKQ